MQKEDLNSLHVRAKVTDDDIDLVGVGRLLLKQKWIVLITILVCTLSASVYAYFFLQPTYYNTTVLTVNLPQKLGLQQDRFFTYRYSKFYQYCTTLPGAKVSADRERVISIKWVAKDPAKVKEIAKFGMEQLVSYVANDKDNPLAQSRMQLERKSNEIKHEIEQVEKGRLKEGSNKSFELDALRSVYSGLRTKLALVQMNEIHSKLIMHIISAPKVIHELYRPGRGFLVLLAFITSACTATFLVVFMDEAEKLRDKIFFVFKKRRQS